MEPTKEQKKKRKPNSMTCAMNGCGNNTAALERWEAAVCLQHNIEQRICKCPPPFRLLSFPLAKTEATLREQWTKLVSIENSVNNQENK